MGNQQRRQPIRTCRLNRIRCHARYCWWNPFNLDIHFEGRAKVPDWPHHQLGGSDLCLDSGCCWHLLFQVGEQAARPWKARPSSQWFERGGDQGFGLQASRVPLHPLNTKSGYEGKGAYLGRDFIFNSVSIDSTHDGMNRIKLSTYFGGVKQHLHL